MNQDDRDKILQIIDSKEKVSNEDLFLYDLTPYYSLNDDDEDYFSKILSYQMITNRMCYDKNISFTPEQKRIFKEILIPGRYAISATTSFGKTTLIKEFIKKNKPHLVIYVVPTNSLADELLGSFEKIYSEDGYEIIDTSVSDIRPDFFEYLIFIGTQEKLSEIKWLKKQVIDLFVIDEAYKLSDELIGYREISLNRNFFDFINISKTFILLLPLVNNIIGLDAYNIKLLKSDYSPVAKTFIGVNHDDFDRCIVNKIGLNDEKNLVYFNSPSALEDFFWKNVSNFNDIVSEDDWIKRVSNDFHEEWLPIIAYKKGIAIHNGNIPKFIQIRMVKQFNNHNSINTIFSTSSLIEGVNTPTKNIFIKDNNIFSEKNRIKYKNLIGRAGRLNITPVGMIYYDSKYQLEFEVANMNWKNIDLRLIIQNDDVVKEINRENSSQDMIQFCDKYEIDYLKFVDFLEISGLTLLQLGKLIENLKKYDDDCKSGFFPIYTTALPYLFQKCYYGEIKLFKYCVPKKSDDELNSIISNSGKDIEQQKKNIPFSYLKLLFSVTINSYIGKMSLYDISSMFNYVKNNMQIEYFNCNNSQIISSIIGMIYSFLPYELIPFLENIILLNELFVESGKTLISSEIIEYINNQIGKYNLKYFGKVDCTDKERKIIKRLFEYGIPYQHVKDYMDYLVNEVNDNFSINHIKRAIFKNDILKDRLEKYFN